MEVSMNQTHIFYHCKNNISKQYYIILLFYFIVVLVRFPESFVTYLNKILLEYYYLFIYLKDKAITNYYNALGDYRMV